MQCTARTGFFIKVNIKVTIKETMDSCWKRHPLVLLRGEKDDSQEGGDLAKIIQVTVP